MDPFTLRPFVGLGMTSATTGALHTTQRGFWSAQGQAPPVSQPVAGPGAHLPARDPIEAAFATLPIIAYVVSDAPRVCPLGTERRADG